MDDGSVIILSVFIAGLLAFLVASDAQRRGLSVGGWGCLTFLLPIVGIPAYLVTIMVHQPPVPIPPPPIRVCPKCGITSDVHSRFCASCGKNFGQE